MNGPSSSDCPTDSPAALGRLHRCREAASSWAQTVASVLKPERNQTGNWLESSRFHWLSQVSVHSVDCGYLAVSEGDGFALVSAHVFIDALLKLSRNKSTVFPTALRVRQPLPFTKVVGITCGRLLIRMSCKIQATMKVNKHSLLFSILSPDSFGSTVDIGF